MTRARTIDACARSVEAEQDRDLLDDVVTGIFGQPRRTYKDFVHTRRDPETGVPVWPLRIIEQRNGR